MRPMQLCRDTSHTMPPGLCSMQQHPYYGATLRHMGAQVHQIVARDGSRRIAQVQLIERRFGPARLLWLPQGPVWGPGACLRDRQTVLSQLATALDHPAGLLGCADDIHDIHHYHQAGFRALWTPQYRAELPLTLPQSSRLATQSQKWRNRLRHAERSALCIGHRPFHPQKDDWLLHRDRAQQRAKDYTALPTAFAKAWATCQPHSARLFLAHLNARIVAAILILRHPPTASYHIGWSGPEGRAHSAHNLLIWTAANWLARTGCQRLDLGSVDTQNAPGLARFKLGSGAKLRPTGPTMLRLPGLARRRVAA